VRGVAVEVAERMGVMDAIREKRTNLRGSAIINGKGKHMVDVDDPNVFGMRQENDAEIMRGDLANILYDFTKNDTTYIFNDSITGIAQSDGGVNVTFRDRPTGTFDLVIGADGLRSNVRNLAFGDDPAFVSDLGFYVSIFTIPNYF
jgi:2-polyprenyl-6-methoxyphenol hydroxylase-like FAD-dependent oxidoreductase